MSSQPGRHSTGPGTADTPGRSSGCLYPWPVLPLGDSLAFTPGEAAQSPSAMALRTIQRLAPDSSTFFFRQNSCESFSSRVHAARMARNRDLRPPLLRPKASAFPASGSRVARQIRRSLTAPARARRPPIDHPRTEVNDIRGFVCGSCHCDKSCEPLGNKRRANRV